MPGELQKGDVFFPHWILNADGAQFPAGEPDNDSPRAAQLPLKPPRLYNRQLKMLLE
jgi:hypothetical protein